MRIGIICDGKALKRWQLAALDAVGNEHEIFLLVANDHARPRRSLRHALYYLLNLFTIRNAWTRAVPFPSAGARVAGRIDFTCVPDGAWSRLPDDVLRWIAEQRIDAVVKFGLNLLRIPPAERFGIPILSYHHGDPRSFRGRPAGFYEVSGGERYVGQIVQILSNKLDAGEVLAFAETRVVPHSYRRTLEEAYQVSPHLLGRALAAWKAGERLPIAPTGRNYKLPHNGAVAGFCLKLMRRTFRRLFYGLFIEKRWRVSTTSVSASDPIGAVNEAAAKQSSWRDLEIADGFTFYADPFFFEDSKDILVEAMNRATGKGELLRRRGNATERISGFGGHVSYPASFVEHGVRYLIPESADWSAPMAYRLDGAVAIPVQQLAIAEPALLDPTLFARDGRVYLFANRASEGLSILRLWSAPSLFGTFTEHPASPIRVSVRGSRMAGAIVQRGDTIVRLGQDFQTRYGDGLLAFRIVELGPEQYREELIGEARFEGAFGPHTLNMADGELLFDWYVERMSPLAGLRRLLNRM